MSIFGPSVKEPKNFDNSIYYKNFIKAFDKLRKLSVKNKDESFDLRNLLFKPLAGIKLVDSKATKYYVKMSTKALLQLVETATAYDDYAKKEVLIDKDIMQNAVEPLVWAQLNPDTELAKQIFVVAKNVSDDEHFDIKFFQALSDEEMKLNYVRHCRGAFHNANIKNDLRKLVFNPKCMDFGAIGELFCSYKFKLSKEEFEILWAKYKPYLMDCIQQYSGKGVEIDENGVKHVPFHSLVMGLLIGYIEDFVPGFDGVVCDGKYKVWAPYDSWSSDYISMQFIDRFDTAVYEMKAAQEKDEMKKLQLQKDGLDKQFDTEIQAIKDFVAERKIKIQSIKASKQEIDAKLKAIEEENKRKETERAKAELQKKQAEFEALAAQLGVDPADLLALQQKKQNAAMSQNQKQY